MSSLNAFLVAVEMAERKRDEARQVLQDAQRARQASQAQLQQLEGYALETQGRWGAQADTTVKPEVMYHHYQFMDRLAHAVGLQTGVVGDQAGRVEHATRAVLAAELRLAALKKVVEKRRIEMDKLQARRDQKQTDERAALQFGKENATQGQQGPQEW
ncbi:flagellar export protein FliJ [Acidovorax sp. SUPP2825]|uniref:flagellar export protein FliJ n=1 Tax=Acidovorax sp. SUPP2825 TaxID=2920879 RepID=UPI0023DE55A4|nr:flagellar export protein FliJ [Acidovorax sp. SUPP2825]GKS97296.1 flagellar export protein FliJ [Acidovorax sp. SUPP2825]